MPQGQEPKLPLKGEKGLGQSSLIAKINQSRSSVWLLQTLSPPSPITLPIPLSPICSYLFVPSTFANMPFESLVSVPIVLLRER